MYIYGEMVGAFLVVKEKLKKREVENKKKKILKMSGKYVELMMEVDKEMGKGDLATPVGSINIRYNNVFCV